MDRTSTRAQALTGVGIVMLVLGLGAGALGLFAIPPDTTLALSDVATIQVLLLVATGILLTVGIMAMLLGAVVAGIHSSLVDHSDAMRR